MDATTAAAVAHYLRAANQFSREAMLAARSARMDLWAELTLYSEILRNAAEGERIDPPVDLWPSPMPKRKGP